MPTSAPAGDAPPIVPYEDWMEDQVLGLFCREYGVTQEAKRSQFHRFFNHPYQSGRAIRLVALDDRKVAGFQGWFRWPYVHKGRQLNAYQTGSSIVHEDYRGRGILTKLLDSVEPYCGPHDIDFLTVFPVKAALGGYLRTNWHHIMDLVWYVRPITPGSALSGPRPIELETTPPPFVDDARPRDFRVSNASDFREWRAQYTDITHYFHVERRGEATTRFELKARRHGRIHEMILGDVQTTGDDDCLRSSLAALVRELKRQRCCTMLSIAINLAHERARLRPILRRLGFFRLPSKPVRYCVRDRVVGDALLDATRWHLHRADIDVW